MSKKTSEIYFPREDSYFLSEILKEKIPNLLNQNKNLKVLDMGSGSGIQAQTCIISGVNEKNIFLADINKSAISELKKHFKKSKVIYSDLFSNISKKEKFDLIIFNPPYLSKHKFDNEKDTAGGNLGSEVINKFLKHAKNHLKDKGKIYLLTSSFTKKINFLKYNKKLIAERKLFFEKLYVWELSLG